MATSQSQKIGVFPDQSTLSLCHSETEWDNALYMQSIIASRMGCTVVMWMRALLAPLITLHRVKKL